MADLSFLFFCCSLSPCRSSVWESRLESGGVTSPGVGVTSPVSPDGSSWWEDESWRSDECRSVDWDDCWDDSWDDNWDEVELVVVDWVVEMMGWSVVELRVWVIEMSFVCLSNPSFPGWFALWWLDLSDFNFLNKNDTSIKSTLLTLLLLIIQILWNSIHSINMKFSQKMFEHIRKWSMQHPK